MHRPAPRSPGIKPLTALARGCVCRCIMAFKTKMDNGAEVTCGDLDTGRTTMSQFTEASALNALGFRKYCMKRTPVCTDCNNDTCCTGSNQAEP